MAQYTMELREFIESYSPDDGSVVFDDIVETGRTKLFDFDYPLYDSSYKQTFETNFIHNFYMREIGFETEGLFKLALRRWLNQNMPYWNQMYESEQLTYNPLQNNDVTSSHNKTNDKTETNTNNSTVSGTKNNTRNSSVTENDFDRALVSDNPDTRLEITASDGSGIIEYASSIEENTSNNSSTTSDTINDTSSATNNSTSNNTTDATENFSESSSGKIGSMTYPEMIKKHREIFLRIDKEIFKEMNDLFMLIY